MNVSCCSSYTVLDFQGKCSVCIDVCSLHLTSCLHLDWQSLTELHRNVEITPRFWFWCHRRPLEGSRHEYAVQQEIIA